MENKFKFFLIAFLIIVLAATSSLSVPTLVVEETDLVKLEVDYFDPDGDEVTVIYSAPLDKNGEWQTDYGDAGNYSTTVVVSDGKDITEEEVLIIVYRKNKAPDIIVTDHVIASERELIKLNIEVSDPNKDDVEVLVSEPFDSNWEWFPGYEDAGEYSVTITATDGELESTKVIRVTVENKNRPPEITVNPKKDLVELQETESYDFEVLSAVDQDGDDLIYLWELDGEIVDSEEIFTYSTDYESAGTHTLKLIVSDGEAQVTHEWEIEVENVNRAPVLMEFDELVIKEGQNLVLDLPEFDEDGDKITYFVDEPIGDDLEWQTGYEDAGEYEFTIVASDGELEAEAILLVTVENVDRAPEFFGVGDVEINEGEELRLSLDANDPDGDEIYYLAYGFPDGAVLDGGEISWQPDFDFVKKPSNLVMKALGRLHVLDKFFWKKKDLNVNLVACGGDLCSNQTVKITVNNVNRPPMLSVADEVVINETDKLRIKPQASDLDGDYVKFYFTEPLNSNGQWQPGFDDAGEYWINVGATDGKESVEKTVRVVVNNVNRQPEIEKIADRNVNEGEDVWIKLEANDPDNDDLTVWVEEAPEGSTFENQLFHWVPSYDSVTERQGWWAEYLSNFKFLNRKLSPEKKNYGLNFVVSDGDFIISKLVNIAVRNWNRAPEIINSTPDELQVFIGEPVLFGAEVVDSDGDALEYEWDLGFMQGSVKNADKIQRRFTTPGEKTVKLTVSDGRDSVEKIWRVIVANKRIVEPVETVEEPVVEEPVEEPVQQIVFKSYAIDG